MEVEDWMKIGTYHTHYDELRMEIRAAAREMWVVYSELVRAGFNEDQSLALMLELRVEGEEE